MVEVQQLLGRRQLPQHGQQRLGAFVHREVGRKTEPLETGLTSFGAWEDQEAAAERQKKDFCYRSNL